MRAAARLLASVRSGKFLEAGAPTGLTGLVTHPSPRSTLLYHYNATLDKLKQIPESSVYRQSTEALTRHRLKIIEEATPAGWDEWQERIQMQISEDPEAFQFVQTSGGTNIIAPKDQDIDTRLKDAEWDGEIMGNFPEGIRSAAQRRPHIQKMKGDKNYKPERTFTKVNLEPEPQYTAEAYVCPSAAMAFAHNKIRIAELESRIGGGLIEEVVQVAEGEHQLVDHMIEAKV